MFDYLSHYKFFSLFNSRMVLQQLFFIFRVDCIVQGMSVSLHWQSLHALDSLFHKTDLKTAEFWIISLLNCHAMMCSRSLDYCYSIPSNDFSYSKQRIWLILQDKILPNGHPQLVCMNSSGSSLFCAMAKPSKIKQPIRDITLSIITPIRREQQWLILPG